mgnify:CR=1 FL=1
MSTTPNPHALLACAVLVVLAAASAAAVPLPVEFVDTPHLRLVTGTRDGVIHDPEGYGGEHDEATHGLLHRRDGTVIGGFTVVFADELDSVARVDRLRRPHSLEEVEHLSIPDLKMPFLKFEALPADRFFHLTPAPGSPLEHGATGDLLDDAGEVAAQFQVVAGGGTLALGAVTTWAEGAFPRDIEAAVVRSYLEQVVGGTGFANLTLANLVMLLVGGLFIYLGIAKEYEPLLLVPIGFGVLLGYIPLPLQLFDAISVYMVDPVTHQYTFNTSGNSVLGLIYFGVRSGLLPPLIFLGIGALTDFTALLSSPRSVLLGAAAQVGIFVTFLGALKLGFSPANAAAIGIIGGADGPTAIFISSRLAPSLIGPIAIAAYSYMAMVPIIQPPIMKLLTSREERRIRMKPGRTVRRIEKILFPVIGTIVTCLVAPGGLPLLGMLFFGNLLKESGVTTRLSKTASSSLLDIATILLGVAVGASTSAQVFLTGQSILIFVLGCVAFGVATASGVLFAKLMNLVSTTKINPPIGAPGVSPVPASAQNARKRASKPSQITVSWVRIHSR